MKDFVKTPVGDIVADVFAKNEHPPTGQQIAEFLVGLSHMRDIMREQAGGKSAITATIIATFAEYIDHMHAEIEELNRK